MAINQPPKMASQFWPSFKRKIISLTLLSQLTLSTTIITTLIATNPAFLTSLVFWSVAVTFILISTIMSALIVNFASSPARDLLSVVIQVSGEKSALTPPNPNDTKLEKTGMKDALQTIYELALKKNDPINNEQKNIDESDQARHKLIEEALDTTTCGVVAINSQKKISYFNHNAPVHIDTENNPVFDLLFNGNDTLENWLDSCDNNAVHAERVWVRIPDRLPNQEGRRFFDVYASYQKGKQVETVLTLVDRTSAYIVDEENLDFISFAAHELRGPITVIRGYLSVLNDELDPVFEGDQKELFHRLIVSSNRLSGYIDNILNTSRYDRRHLKVHLVEENIKDIYDTISDDMSLRAGSQNRLLNVSFPENLPTIAADRASISEVLGNLIDNAIKYSNEGGSINVTAKVNGDFVEVSVEDHGIGMPANVITNLFQKFYRSHRSRETVSGTGIGLYISKAIVESHGGSIGVRSEDGHGSTFMISLPIYSTVADKLQASHNNNEGLISEGRGWIKNHSMYRG